MSSILVIPDCHSQPDSDSSRFSVLGRFITQYQPETIVCLGDFLDMASLSSYDRGKWTGESRRVLEDFRAGERDLTALLAPIDEYNKNRRKKAKKQYTPHKVFLWGNHEARITKWTNEHPEFKGLVETHFADFLSQWDEVVGFKTPYIREGIAFSHFFPNKMGRALGGKNAARSLLLNTGMSCVAGHSHNLDFATEARVDGTKMFGLVAGWYGDEAHSEEWSNGTDQNWWNGVVLLADLEDGFPQQQLYITQQRMREGYA